MSRKLRAAAVDRDRPLAAFLAERLGEDLVHAAARITLGSVFVDGKRVRDPERPLTGDERITVHAETAAVAAEWTVPYLDDQVLVVDKPSGLPVQATRGAGGALDEQVAAQYPGARLFHRIDRDTSGLVLFTRTAEAQRLLGDALARGKLHREYQAIVAGVPTFDERTLDAPIGPDPADHRRHRAGVPGGKPARSHVRVLERGADQALVAVVLDTGRTHQVRVHLAHAGHPILGDTLYAPPAIQARAPRLLLDAHRLSWPGGSARSGTVLRSSLVS